MSRLTKKIFRIPSPYLTKIKMTAQRAVILYIFNRLFRQVVKSCQKTDYHLPCLLSLLL